MLILGSAAQKVADIPYEQPVDRAAESAPGGHHIVGGAIAERYKVYLGIALYERAGLTLPRARPVETSATMKPDRVSGAGLTVRCSQLRPAIGRRVAYVCNHPNGGVTMATTASEFIMKLTVDAALHTSYQEDPTARAAIIAASGMSEANQTLFLEGDTDGIMAAVANDNTLVPGSVNPIPGEGPDGGIKAG